MEINQELAAKVLKVVDAGLCSGVGTPVPGQMCVEAAVTFALGEEFSDKPSCVNGALRSFKISLNDTRWSSNQARAKGMRRLAIAQLGTKSEGYEFDEQAFTAAVTDLAIRKAVPYAMRAAAKVNPKFSESLLAAADRCEKEGTIESAESARSAAYAAYAYAAAYAAYANAAAYAAAYAAANAAANAAAYAAAYAAANAAANAAAYASDIDSFLSEFAEDVVQVLIKLETPGSKFLFLTEQE